MREIKFRAWNRNDRKMYTPDSKGIIIEINGYNQFWIKDTKYLQEWFLGNNLDSNLMQFIGRQDVDGKDIYEGDIVSYFSYNTENKKTGAVKYVDGDGCFCIDFLPLHSMYSIKVIGNIYENPELIEVNCLK